MEPAYPALQDENSLRIWREILQPMSRDMRASAPRMSAEIAAGMSQTFPQLFEVEGSIERNRAATEANITLGAGIIEGGGDPTTIELPAVAAAYGLESLHSGISLASLVRGVRLGHAEVSRWASAWLREHVEDRDELAAASSLASTWMFAIADALSTASEVGYALERERWLRSAAAVRTDTITEILAGREIDAVGAGQRLRYELDREHLAVIAWVEPSDGGGDALSVLDSAVRALAEASGAGALLIQPSGLLVTWAWLSHARAPAADALDSLQPGRGATPAVRMALGEPARGVAGFRASHEQAVHARRVARLEGRPAWGITRYGEVALQATVSTDIEQARAFAAHKLGRLFSDDEKSRRLAATLEVYLGEQCSRIRAARRLGIHENTVSYRIRQAEEILGHSVQDDTLGLRVALAIAPMLAPGNSDGRGPAETS